MTEIDKAALQTGRARSVEPTDIDPEVEIDLIKKEINQDKDIIDEVSFYRQIKFTKSDSEKLTKKALGQNAFKRSDDPDFPKIKEKEYQESEKLAPQIQTIWRKMEKERIRATFRLNEVSQEKLKNGLSENEIKELNELSRFLEEKIDTLDDIQGIIIEKKTPVEIIKAIDSAIIEFNNGGVDESITILSNYKNQISKIINNKEKNMIPEESPIIDPELKINEDENNRIEDGGIEQEESLQEVVERSESEIAHVQNSIKAETENGKADVEQKSETIEDPLVKNQVLADAQKSSSETVQAVGSAADAVKKETNEVIKAQAPETETKNPELRAKQERIKSELQSAERTWSVFKSGKGEEFDALINQQAEDLGIADKPKETIEGLVRSRLENSRAALKEVRSILNKSNSIEEFNQEIQNYLDLMHKFEKKELNEASLMADTKKRGKKERKIKNKHRFAGEVLMQYLPSKKEESELVDGFGVPIEAWPTMDKTTDQEKIDNFRKGIANAKAAGDDDTVLDLEKMVAKLKQRIQHSGGKAAEEVQAKKNEEQLELDFMKEPGADQLDKNTIDKFNFVSSNYQNIFNLQSLLRMEKDQEKKEKLKNEINELEERAKEAIDLALKEIKGLPASKKIAGTIIDDKSIMSNHDKMVLESATKGITITIEDEKKYQEALERRNDYTKALTDKGVNYDMALAMYWILAKNIGQENQHTEEEEKESTILKGYRYNAKTNASGEVYIDKEEIDVDVSKLSEYEKKVIIERWINDGKNEKNLDSARKIVDSLKDDKSKEEYGRWIKEKELTPGDFVKVKRSDGKIDDYWEYKGIDPETGRAIVISERFENEKPVTLQKLVSLDELKSLNGKVKPAEEPKVEAKGEEVKTPEPAKEAADKGESKEKTAEEILREKNIEVYGGEEKFNKIIEAYQKLNELVDQNANSIDDKGNPINKELFKEWDELRVNLAGAKIVAMDEKMGIDIHGEKEIKHPETKIREFYDKLSDPVEIFAKDSIEDTIVRAATLIKHRNELADRLSRVKNANTEAQIRDLDNKIEILNQKLSERRDPSKPATPLSELVISSFKKAEVKKGEESAEEKLSKEAEKIKSELENMSPSERRKIGIGLRNIGFFVQEKKSAALARTCEVLIEGGGWLVNRVTEKKQTDAKEGPIQTKGTFARFFASLSETYRNDESRARKMIETTDSPGKMKHLQNAGYLSGNILKYGRTVADIVGWTAGSPLRYVMIGAQVFSRGAEAAKYARLKNAEVINKTRLDCDEAVNLAYAIYEAAKKYGAEKGGKEGSDAIEKAYIDNLPQDLLDRLKKSEPGNSTELLQSIFKKQMEMSIKYGGKISKNGFEKRLKEFDGMLSKYGTIDALAMGAHYAEKGGKAVMAVAAIEGIYRMIRNIPQIAENLSFGRSGGSGHIPPQEGSTPDGDMAGYESGKGPEMFPGEKYFGVEANPEKVKELVARFYEESRYNPEWKNNLLEQAKALGGLRQQLVETAGIKDPDALKEIIDSAKEQLNGDGNVFIVKGGSQEAQNLSGAEATIPSEEPKISEMPVGAKTEATQLVNEIENTDGIKHDSIWRSTYELVRAHAKEMGMEYPGKGGTKLSEVEWYNLKTSQLVNELDKNTTGGIKDLVYEGNKVVAEKGSGGNWRINIEQSSGFTPGRLADLHHNVAGVKASAIENESSDPEFAPIHQEPIWEPMVNQPQATDHPWDNQPKQTAGNPINEIFDYPFGRQGAETMTYQNVKNEIAENFLRRNLSREVDVNDPFAIDSDDARRYGELQNYINDMAKKPGNYPRAGETADQFIHRLNRDIVTTPEHAVPDAAPGKTIPPHESAQKLEIDKEFFKEEPSAGAKNPTIEQAAKMETSNNIKIDTDKFSGDIKFKYDASGNPTELLPIDHEELRRITGSEYFDKSNLKSFDYLTKADGKDLVTRVEIFKQLSSEKDFKLADVVLEDIKKIATQLDERHNGIVDYSKFPQVLREKLGK